MILVSRVVTFSFRKIDERRNARDARDDARRARRDACISFPSNARARRRRRRRRHRRTHARAHATTEQPTNRSSRHALAPKPARVPAQKYLPPPSTNRDQAEPPARGGPGPRPGAVDRSTGSIDRSRVPSIADVDRARPRALSNARSNDASNGVMMMMNE